jgi:hypothetical protein
LKGVHWGRLDIGTLLKIRGWERFNFQSLQHEAQVEDFNISVFIKMT